MQIVDGQGTDRVLRALGASRIVIRPATAADSSNLYGWRNDPVVRAVSRETALIERAGHDAWLVRTLADPQRVLLVGEEGGRPVGVVRFDLAGGDAEVSIYLVPGPTRTGLGSDLLVAAESWLGRTHREVRRVRAEVLGANERSHRLFRSNGYETRSTIYERSVSTDE
jgi:RimJ/RimL family protein N-acetyltransferase